MSSHFIQHAAAVLGGEVIGPDAILCPGPGHSPRDRSLKVMLQTGGGFVCHSFAGDDWRTCKDYVKKMLNVDEVKPRAEAYGAAIRAGKQGTDEATRTAWAMQIWDAAGPPGGTIRRYLATRSLELPRDLCEGDVIRFHSSCPFRLEDGTRAHLPAMVCLFRDVATDAPVGIHRTALEPDGSGKSKRFNDPTNCRQMLGRASGAAIKLSPDSEVTAGLAISEGVENALTAICGGLRPVWALGSATFIKGFQVLSGIECLTILADHDRAGLDAARSCAKRWAASGREVTIAYPADHGADWNDAGRAA